MSEVFLIHEPDVYFDVVKPKLKKDDSVVNKLKHKPQERYWKLKLEQYEQYDQLHHGEIYISLGQIFLHDERRWYKAYIKDIKKIKTVVARKELIINFLNFDVVLTCNELSHLLMLRDFLLLSHNFPRAYSQMPPGASKIKGDNNYHRLYRRRLENFHRNNN